MYKKAIFQTTSIEINNTYEGETIEQKVQRIMTNNEPITDGAEIIYQERGDGVQPGYNIRTDRHEIAIEAMDKVNASKQATRAEYLKELADKKKPKEDPKEPKITEGESIQGTSGQSE